MQNPGDREVMHQNWCAKVIASNAMVPYAVRCDCQEKKKKAGKFKAEVCDKCTQTKNYILKLDRGTALIVLALSHAVGRLGRNRVHMQREMEASQADMGGLKKMVEAGYINSNMTRNIARARYHGLIAFYDRDGGTGEYLITRKGGAFLQGAKVPRTAIIDKVHGHNAGYWDEEHDQITIFQLLKESSTWVIPRFEIHQEGSFQPSLL